MSGGRLRNKVAIITGGNRGLGFASARRFLEEGAKVAIFSRDAERNRQALAALELLGEAIAIQGSVTNIEDLERMAAETISRFGAVDVLFVNHGVTENIGFFDVTEEIYDRVMDTNAKGAFFAVQKVATHMKPGSSIVLCTSSAVHLALATQMHYTASKQALDSFRRTMAAALIGRGIRVNALCPGMMKTEMLEGAHKSEAEAAAYNEAMRSFIPIGRGAEPEEVAEAALFLACDDSSYMTGAEVVVDGGLATTR